MLNNGKLAEIARPDLNPVRVMVVDDSVVVRGLLSRWIDHDPELAVVGAFRNAQTALDQLVSCDPDVVILDVEMPGMDGLSALPQLLSLKPELAVIMASTLTQRNAKISLEALAQGAVDYLPKPTSRAGIISSHEFQRDLLDKIRVHGGREMIARPPVVSRAPVIEKVHVDVSPSHSTPDQLHKPDVIVIGASTGGPQALTQLFGELGPFLADTTVLIAQHMPAMFTTILAEHIKKASGRLCREAQDGMTIEPGCIYVAPGGKHMTVESRPNGHLLNISEEAPRDFCRPSVNSLLESTADAFGGSLMAIILTGMGEDGTCGANAVRQAGGSVLVQNEESSVVWGMPGSVAKAGHCDQILDLDGLAKTLKDLLVGGANDTR